jgi:hypothetical protein
MILNSSNPSNESNYNRSRDPTISNSRRNWFSGSGRDRPSQHLSCGAPRHASSDRSAPVNARTFADRCAGYSGRFHSPELFQQRRWDQLLHCRGIHYRQNSSRQAHGRAGKKISRLWFRSAQGLRHVRAPERHPRTRALSHPSDVFSFHPRGFAASFQNCFTASNRN